jgi:8-oxo-dGTP pyrophosphatase MutT (NUDIX family)
MSKKLLRQYIREVLGGADPHATGKDSHAGNLYSTGHGQMPAIVRRQGGNVLDDEKAEEEATLQNEKQAACCLILSDNGRVLAVSRKDDPTAFGLPGGKVEQGETPAQAAARELREETGLIATSLRRIFVDKDSTGYTTTTFATQVKGEINTSESGVVRWVTPDVLFAGPFGDYNKRLWMKLGLSRAHNEKTKRH